MTDEDKSYLEVRNHIRDELRAKHEAIDIEPGQAQQLADLIIQRKEELLGIHDLVLELFILRHCSALEVNPW